MALKISQKKLSGRLPYSIEMALIDSIDGYAEDHSDIGKKIKPSSFNGIDDDLNTLAIEVYDAIRDFVEGISDREIMEALSCSKQ